MTSVKKRVTGYTRT